MAHVAFCAGFLAMGLAVATPALAQEPGLISISQVQIDPHMTMMNDGSGADPAAAQSHRASPGQHGGPQAGVPLDQADGDDDASAGDDPASDNADESDTVYSA